jgi:cardiolipin synthase
MSRRRSSVLLVAALCGCAAIVRPPPAPPALQVADARAVAPRVVDGRGELSPAASREIVRTLSRHADSDLPARHLAAIESLVATPLVTGNAAELLVDGPATHAAMFAAIERARDHVNLETYILEAGPVGERLAQLLARKRSDGVVVNVLYDSVGAIGTRAEYFERLRAAGIEVCEFNPVNPAKAPAGWRLNNRNHRKNLVVDGRVAFAGGVNISEVYASSSSPAKGRNAEPAEDGWRDTHVRLSGPIVADFQRLFLEAWGAQQCPPVAAAQYFPAPARTGRQLMRMVAQAPGGERNDAYVALLSAFENAERRVWLTFGYFVPDPRMLDALKAAAARGVDVRLALPGVSDFWAPLYAGRSHYAALLDANIRIFERKDALLHAKTAVVDGVWSSVGSTNLDWRSFVHNYEVNVIVLDRAFGREMEALFERDQRAAAEITRDAWRDRGLRERALEWFARQWEELL